MRISYDKLHNRVMSNLIGSADILAGVTKSYPVSPDPTYAVGSGNETNGTHTLPMITTQRSTVVVNKCNTYTHCSIPYWSVVKYGMAIVINIVGELNGDQTGPYNMLTFTWRLFYWRFSHPWCWTSLQLLYTGEGLPSRRYCGKQIFLDSHQMIRLVRLTQEFLS